jgi:ubiquinone/menaquinone biosynthesis C-methylase UbiE
MGRENSKKHSRLERHSQQEKYENILEIGSGEFEHFQYVTHQFNKFIALDIQKPKNLEGWQTLPQNKFIDLSKIGKGNYFVQADAKSIPFGDNTFNRVVAGCVLMHVENPFETLQEWLRVLKPGGQLDFLISCEPSIALRIARQLFAEPRARKMGWNFYNLVNAVDHKSNAPACLEITRYVLDKHRFKTVFYPFSLIRSWNLNFYVIIYARKVP